MKQVILLFALFFLCRNHLSIAQVAIPDSIATFLAQQPKDVKFIEQLNAWTFDCLTSSPELARELAMQAIKFSKEINDDKGYTTAIDNVGNSYWMIGDYENALTYYQLAAKEAELKKDTTTMIREYNNMAEVYKKINEYNKAIELLRIAINWSAKHEHDALTIYNLGEVYLLKHDLLTAYDYYNQALKQAIKENNNRTIAYCYQGLGTIKFKNQEFYAALAYFSQSENLWKSLKDYRSLAQNYKDYAEVLMSLSQFDKAEQYLNKSIRLAHKINAPDLQINNYLKSTELFVIQGNFKKGYEFLNMHNAHKDSVFNQKKTENINRMKIAFDTEAHREENRQLKEAQLLKDSKIKSQQTLITAITISLVIVGFLAFSLYQQHRRISDVNEILRSKTVEIQLQKGEIEVQARTLNDLNGQLKDLNKSLESKIQKRTSQLIGQNEKLAKYAHANAHLLRAPVVSILGLLNLLDNVQLQSEDKILITHLQKCGKELDNITRTINQNLEEETASNKEG